MGFIHGRGCGCSFSFLAELKAVLTETETERTKMGFQQVVHQNTRSFPFLSGVPPKGGRKKNRENDVPSFFWGAFLGKGSSKTRGEKILRFQEVHRGNIFSGGGGGFPGIYFASFFFRLVLLRWLSASL
jgi:hypothetical protein